MKKVPKKLSSKNISSHIYSLLLAGRVDLAMDILKAKELASMLPNILNLIKRINAKSKEKNKTKIYSKTDIDKLILKKLEKILAIDVGESNIIIDDAMSAGIKIKSKDVSIDATIDAMLKNAIDKILKVK